MKTKSLEKVKLLAASIADKSVRLLEIKDPTSLSRGVEILSRLNKVHDELIEDRERITKPLNEALKEVRAKYKPVEEQLVSAISVIREKMSAYQTALIQEAKKKEEELAKQLSSGEVSLDNAVMALSQSPVDSVESASGRVKFRTDYRLKILDPHKIPRTYLIIDEKFLLNCLKAGDTIPGAALEEVQVPINYRS